MKTSCTRALVLLVVALSVVAAQAQTKVMLKGTVPFEFSIGDHSLPAGTYTVTAITENVEFWYADSGRGLFAVNTIPAGKLGALNTYKLVFHRYGDQYFLTEVWNEGKSHSVRVSDREAAMAKVGSFETIAVLMKPHR